MSQKHTNKNFKKMFDFYQKYLNNKNMDYLEVIKGYEKIGFLKQLGIKITEITDNAAKGKIKITKKMENYMSSLHGGVIASFIDTIAFFPGKLIPSGNKITTLSLEVKYLKTVNIGEELTGLAQIVHLGKKMGVIEVNVYNSINKLVAKGIVSVLVIN